MGNPISKIIEQQAAENKQKATDLLTSMYTMGSDKAELYKANLITKPAQDEIPINKTVYKDTTIKCSVKNDATAIADGITGIISAFCDGDIIGGISKSLAFVIGAVLGNVAGNMSEKTSYMLSIKGLAIYRLDYYCYLYEYKDESLAKITENCLVVVYMISSIKYKDIDKETLYAVIAMNVDDPVTQEAMFKKIDDIYTDKNYAYLHRSLAEYDYKNYSDIVSKKKIFLCWKANIMK